MSFSLHPGLAMMTLTPGRSLPDSMRASECGAPRSVSVTRSFLSARRSQYTVVGSGEEAPCRHLKVDVKERIGI